MAEKSFDYSGYKARGGAYSLRPQILAKLYGNGQPQDIVCIIDSGSDNTVINAEYAPMLGIDLSKCPTADMGGVIDSGIKGYVATVRIEFDQFPEEFKFNVRFVKNMAIDAILGQSDFFEAFKVRFEKKRRKFYLTKE